MALISYWKLNDLTDEQSLHDIVNAGGADQVANGYDFDGGTNTEYMTVVDTLNSYDFAADAPFTIVVWAKIRNTATTKLILEKYVATQGWYLYCAADGTLNFAIKSTSQALLTLTSDNTYEDDAYHMIVIRRVASSTTVKMWVDDGVAEDKSMSGYQGDLSNTALLTIGRYSVGSSLYLDGELGNTNGVGTGCMGIQIYDTYESDAALGALYSSGWTGKVIGVTDPAKVNPTDVSNIHKVIGVQ